MKFLGHVISPDGSRPDEDKIVAISHMDRPTTVKEVKSFIGSASFYRKFIANFAQIIGPLTDLTKKDVPFV